MTALSDLVAARRREREWSMRRLADAAGVSVQTISTIEAGDHGKVSEKVIAGLSKALGVSEAQLSAAAGQRYQPVTEYVLPERAGKLRPELWQAVVDEIDKLLALQERLDEQRDRAEG